MIDDWGIPDDSEWEIYDTPEPEARVPTVTACPAVPLVVYGPDGDPVSELWPTVGFARRPPTPE